MNHKFISSNNHYSILLSGSSGPSLSKKAPSSSAKPQPWQSGRPTSAQNKPWMSGSGSGSATKTSSGSQSANTQPAKPNYNLNFSSVIGGREERGVRGPGFGTFKYDLTSNSILQLLKTEVEKLKFSRNLLQ